MHEKRHFPVHEREVEKITIERSEPDFDDLSWQTFTYLTGPLDIESPGDDADIARYFRFLLGKRGCIYPGTIYANPCGVVRSPIADSRFIREARHIQREWYLQFNDILASAGRVHREMNAFDPIIRQLVYTGVLFIENRHVFPNCWPDIDPPQRHEPQVKLGSRFGNLVVTKVLKMSQVLCHCDCGNPTTKFRKHLFSGRTKSCGCLQAARQEKLKRCRRNRGWNHTGSQGS